MILTWIEVRIAATSYIGLHWFCRMSRHMLPSAYTTFQKKKTNDLFIKEGEE
jgi:hypothetical protein